MDLAFGGAFGSIGFIDPDPSRNMKEAPYTVLAFVDERKHTNLVLAQQTGDYVAVLPPGHYCIAAYTRSGKALKITKNQRKCIVVKNREDIRLDVMLSPVESETGKP
jgi:hypothetical protein